MARLTDQPPPRRLVVQIAEIPRAVKPAILGAPPQLENRPLGLDPDLVARAGAARVRATLGRPVGRLCARVRAQAPTDIVLNSGAKLRGIWAEPAVFAPGRHGGVLAPCRGARLAGVDKAGGLEDNVINHQTEFVTATELPPITVLLVDDQKFIGMVVKRLLTPARNIALHHCVEAAGAVDIANELRPDVILQDLVMDIDGLIVVGDFRRNAATATTPIVVLSGNDDAATRARAASAGANDYLVKLPSSEVLIACLRRHTARAAAHSALEIEATR